MEKAKVVLGCGTVGTVRTDQFYLTGSVVEVITNDYGFKNGGYIVPIFKTGTVAKFL